jgi:parallel beta-helix repeat protein
MLAFAGCGSRGGGSGFMPSQGTSDAAARPLRLEPAIVVTTLKDSGPGSISRAIQTANARPVGVSSRITFAVKGTIVLTSDLPAIRTIVKIDGTTAPTYKGIPVVAINAHRFGSFVFAAGSGGSQLLGLAIGNARLSGVSLFAGGITITGNAIGFNLFGESAGNGGDGITVSSQSANNIIGANPSRVSGAVSNVISGNAGNGISLHDSSGNTIAANRIGTNRAGKGLVPNHANGILITDGSTGNEIGGTVFVDAATHQVNNPTGNKGTVTPVFVVPPLGNLVSGNAGDGILIEKGSKNNTLNGNFIGTTADGDSPLPNGGDGVALDTADYTTLAGCKFQNNPFVYYNVVSGNGGNGVHVTDSDNVTIQGNFLGAAANNSASLPNKNDGILIDGSSRSTVVGGVIPLGNVSAGNRNNGIEVADTASGFITFNTFGGLLAFKGAAPNGNDGLLITSTGGGQTVRTNVFSGNTNNGIEIGGNASGIVVDPNIVGLNTRGNGPLNNGGNGLLVTGTAHGNVIGGTTNSVIPQNTFSSNGGYGIAIMGKAHDNIVRNSDVGTDVAGTHAEANALGGIFVGGSANNDVIGGSPMLRNLISGNTGNGVTLASNTSSISIIANFIGLTKTGKALPNSGQAIVVRTGSTNNTISGNVTTPR